MTNPTLHHVNLKTTRLKEMIEWYGSVVGLKPQHLAPVGAWLTNDAANHRLALLAFPGMSDDVDKDGHTASITWLSSFPHSTNCSRTLRGCGLWEFRLQSASITALTTSMYYADPDRNAVELQVDNFHDWAKSSEYMRFSLEFAANPIGVLFDPDRAYDVFKTGKTTKNCIAR